MFCYRFLFAAFLSHGYLPDNIMKTAIVPIVKNKTGDSSEKNNYGPIALGTAASKIFELCLSKILEDYTCAHMTINLYLLSVEPMVDLFTNVFILT